MGDIWTPFTVDLHTGELEGGSYNEPYAWKKGITIGFVTHEPDIAAFTKRNIVFRDGRIIKDIFVKNKLSALSALERLKEEEALQEKLELSNAE